MQGAQLTRASGPAPASPRTPLNVCRPPALPLPPARSLRDFQAGAFQLQDAGGALAAIAVRDCAKLTDTTLRSLLCLEGPAAAGALAGWGCRAGAAAVGMPLPCPCMPPACVAMCRAQQRSSAVACRRPRREAACRPSPAPARSPGRTHLPLPGRRAHAVRRNAAAGGAAPPARRGPGPRLLRRRHGQRAGPARRLPRAAQPQPGWLRRGDGVRRRAGGSPCLGEGRG